MPAINSSSRRSGVPSVVPAKAGTQGLPMTRTLQRQFLIKITPLRVVLLDQLQFPGAPPSLDPLLPNDGILERAIASAGEDVDVRALVAHAEQLPGSPLSRGRRYKAWVPAFAGTTI